MARADWQARWLRRVNLWQSCADEAGFGEIIRALRRALTPLSPIFAQLLWITQPVFSLIGDPAAVTALAEMLEGSPVSADRAATPWDGVL